MRVPTRTETVDNSVQSNLQTGRGVYDSNGNYSQTWYLSRNPQLATYIRDVSSRQASSTSTTSTSFTASWTGGTPGATVGGSFIIMWEDITTYTYTDVYFNGTRVNYVYLNGTRYP